MNMDMRVIKSPKGNKVKFAIWHGGRKHVAQLRTAKAAVSNMIKVGLLPHLIDELGNGSN